MLWGDNDEEITFRQIELLKNTFETKPSSQFHLKAFPGRTHALIVEDINGVNNAVLEFLQKP